MYNPAMHSIRKVLAAMRKADEDFLLFEKGDRIAIGFSGGKDSMVLLAALERYRRFAKKDFSYVAVYLDLGFPGGSPAYLAEFADRVGAPFVKKDAGFVYEALLSHVRPGEGHHLPCSLCSRMKKAAMAEAAHELRCNKVAFAHHLDDAVETFALNLFHAGMAATFSPKMELTRSRLAFIRPLVYAREEDIARTMKEEGFPTPVKVCPSDGITERTKVKGFLKEVYREFPQSEGNLALALTDYRRLDLFFEQGISLPSGYRLEAASTVKRALLLPHRPPRGTSLTYLCYEGRKIIGQLSLREIDAHVHVLEGIHLPKKARMEAICHFEALLRAKTSPMTLLLKGPPKDEKEALGYRKTPRGYAKRLI